MSQTSKTAYEAVNVTTAGNYPCGHRHRSELTAWTYCGRGAAFVRPVYDGPSDTAIGQMAIAEDRAGKWMRSW